MKPRGGTLKYVVRGCYLNVPQNNNGSDISHHKKLFTANNVIKNYEINFLIK